MPTPTTKTRQQLRSLFVRNAIPTQEDYAALINAGINQTDDGILKLPDQPLGLVRQKPAAAGPPSAGSSTPSTASVPAPSGVLNFFGAPEDENPSWQLQLIGTSKPGFGLADQSGTPKLFLDGTTGNLGVGTVSPHQKLTVEGPWNTGKDPANTLSNGGQLAIKGSKAQLDFIDPDPNHSDWAIHVDDSKLSFVRTPWENKDLVLDGKGNVGIGNDSPLAKLDVNGSIRSAGIIQASGYRCLVKDFEFECIDGLLIPLNKNIERCVFSYTGNDQNFLVPAGVEWIFVKLWGAGGGSGRSGTWDYGADGGGGGHTRGLFKVVPNENLIVVVGAGGTTTNGPTDSCGGGGTTQYKNSQTVANNWGGHGGGYCGLFRKTTPPATPLAQADALAIAGGGGGGGASRGSSGNVGGAGGGRSGQRGASPFDEKFSAGGCGGTQASGGGKGGVLTQTNSINGGDGGALRGGTPAGHSHGGAGGGGYFGGGGGAFHESKTMAGGGGGSGYTAPGGLLTGTYTGCWRIPAYSWDPDLLSDLAEVESPGFGGQNRNGLLWIGAPSGGHARAVIYYLKQT